MKLLALRSLIATKILLYKKEGTIGDFQTLWHFETSSFVYTLVFGKSYYFLQAHNWNRKTGIPYNHASRCVPHGEFNAFDAIKILRLLKKEVLSHGKN